MTENGRGAGRAQRLPSKDRPRFAETDPLLSVNGFDGPTRYSTIRAARAAARKFLREHPGEESVSVIFTVRRIVDG